MAVQAFLMEHDWNAQPAVLDEESLNGVRQLGLAARRRAAAGVARTSNLSETVSVGERGARFRIVETALLRRRGFVAFFIPDAHHLRDFLLERHAREEIGDSLVGGEISVLVWQHC